jgi:DNA-binding transcriptional ArsR family regulator
MSVKATTWAYERGRELNLKQGPRFTLVRIADHADHDGVCWPGIAHVAEYTGAGQSTVRRHMQELEDLGLLHRDRRSTRKAGRGRDKDMVVLHLDQAFKVSGSSDEPPADGSVGGDAGVPNDQPPKMPGGSEGDQAPVSERPSAHSDHDQAPDSGDALYREPSNEPSENPDAVAPGYLSNILADLIAADDPNGLRPTVPKSWLDAERLLLERDERDPDEAERVLRWALADDFWQSNVRSLPKFRHQYGRLALQANKQQRPKPRAVPRPPAQADPSNVYDLGVVRSG